MKFKRALCPFPLWWLKHNLNVQICIQYLTETLFRFMWDSGACMEIENIPVYANWYPELWRNWVVCKPYNLSTGRDNGSRMLFEEAVMKKNCLGIIHFKRYNCFAKTSGAKEEDCGIFEPSTPILISNISMSCLPLQDKLQARNR